MLHARLLSKLRAPCQRQLTGLVLTGSYNDAQLQLSAAATHFDTLVSSKLSQLAAISKIKKSRTFYGLHEDYPVVTLAVVEAIEHDAASRDNAAEAVRSAIGVGVTVMSAEPEVTEIVVDSASNARAASEAALLALFKFDATKSKKTPAPVLSQFELAPLPGACTNAWTQGLNSAKSQNLARNLMEMPANHMTPALFVETIQREIAREYGNVTAVVRDRAWIEEQKMGAFLSVSRGSEEPPYLLELHYNGAGDSAPVCLVGKGVTFDTGGISIKPSKGMDAMRADMGGAACVTGATLGAAALGIPINIVTLIALTENMPSGSSTKPGDVVTAMNGITIQVDNTDAEGRLILADALTYADTFNPTHVIDMATLTGAMAVALGGEAAGAYSTGEDLWKTLERAGYNTGDRLWRMPLFKEYDDLLKSATADVNNIGTSPYGGSITAAKFLQRFTKCASWAHLDIAGVMDATSSMSYLPKGMAGRPTRTIIEALKLLANKPE